MLIITFLNDGTGDEIEGNYKWAVYINKTLIANGELKDHNRLTGWAGLVKDFAEFIRLRDRLEVAPARPHKPVHVGSSPTPATKKKKK